jgi:hypothetical protein
VAGFSLTLPRTFRDSVKDSKSPYSFSKSHRSRNFPPETGEGGVAPAQKKPGRAALLMMLVTGLDETTFPTRLCEGASRARDASLSGWSYCK